MFTPLLNQTVTKELYFLLQIRERGRVFVCLRVEGVGVGVGSGLGSIADLLNPRIRLWK